MSTYFAIYNDDGTLVSIGETDVLGGEAARYEISKGEYDRLMDIIERTWKATEKVLAGELAIEDVDEDIREQVHKNAVDGYAERVYRGESIDTVSESMREDVQAAVDALIAERGPIEEQDISDAEALDIIMGVSE